MVGHSQLDSDMLESSPAVPAADAEQEALAAGSSDDEAFQSPGEGHDAEDALPLPQPGVKRKRSSLVQQQAQKVWNNTWKT